MTRFSRTVLPAAFLALSLLLPAQDRLPEASSISLPTSKTLTMTTPGRIGSTNSFPATIAISPDGRYAALLNNGYGTQETLAMQSIAVLDLKTNQLSDYPDNRFGEEVHQSYFIGLVFGSDGKHLYASVGSITDATGEKPGDTGNGIAVVVPKTIPQPLYEIAGQCLQVDPQQRGTVHDIVRRLRAHSVTSAAKEEEQKPRQSSNRWILALIVLAALLLGVWLSVEVLVHRTPTHATDSQSATSQAPTDAPATESSAPFSSKDGLQGLTRGSVLQKVEPDVSRNAQNTITGRLKVSVQVAVDASGTVTQAKFVSYGPSQYFANKALAAAQRWKFNPPQVDGRPTASEWLLRFQFGRTSIQILPEEVKP